ncbi:hypothetical protein LOZ06_006866, partial [Ophidiomyces ophidiicola]
MPLDEEGAKWSCEPCIRGHRSSKCQHFDRLMMKVPKAGRPLAKCPHPKGTCSCQKIYAFMVRIPKGSTCLCRPLYKVPMAGTEPGQSPAQQLSPKASPSLSAPPSTGPTPSRVQKRTRRQNSLQTTSELVAKGLAALADAPDQPAREPPAAAAVFRLAAVPPEQPYPRPAALSSSRPDLALRPPNGALVAPNPPAPAMAPFSQPASVPASPTARCPAPCCDTTRTAERNSTQQQQPKASSPFAYAYPQSPYPYLPFERQFSALDRPPSVHVKAEYANGILPQNPSLAAIPVSLPGPPSYAGTHFTTNDIGQSVLPSHIPNIFTADYSGLEPQSRHNCGCGDGCQCLGCASHPFNDTTRQYIQEMGYMMAFENEDDANQQTSQYNTHGFSPPFDAYKFHQNLYDQSAAAAAAAAAQDASSSTNTAATNNHSNNTHTNGTNNPNYRYQSTTAAASSFAHDFSLPSPVLYDQSHEAVMQPAAYYTLEYPVGIPAPSRCYNAVGTCQCDINCKCIGCLTHDGHNGISLEPTRPPEAAAATTTAKKS